MKKATLLLAAILGFGTSAVQAQLIHWEIFGLTLGPDAAPVTGSFSHNSMTGELFNVSIEAADGQSVVCLNPECSLQQAQGSASSQSYDISPFGFVPTGALPIGSFTFTTAATFDQAISFIPPGSALFLLAVGDLPTTPGVVPILSAGLLELIIPPGTTPTNFVGFDPLADSHRRMTLNSSASLVGRVPEPESLMLLLCGLGLLMVSRQQRARSTTHSA